MPLEHDTATEARAITEPRSVAQAEDASAHVAKRRGRRPSHADRWSKVTVVLLDRQIVYLDRLIADIRAAKGAKIGRAHLIRGLIDALAESDLDLTNSRSERDLGNVLSTRFRRTPGI